jgi:RimJ/RimL family protein N-acetyltransferase
MSAPYFSGKFSVSEYQAFPQLRRQVGDIALRPVQNDDINFLYTLCVSDTTGPTYRLRGHVPAFELFAKQVWQDVLTQSVAWKDSDRIGHLVIYGLNEGSGYAYFASAFLPDYWNTPVTGLCMRRFVSNAFLIYPLRKIYAEVPAYNMAKLASSSDNLFEIEGCLRRHWYCMGDYQDVYIIALYRERFLTRRSAGLEREQSRHD